MPDPKHSDLVTIATAAALQEADVIRVSLAAAGIPAMVHGERTINVLTHIGPAIHPHGIRVMVLPEHAEDARALLARLGEAETDAPVEVSRPRPRKRRLTAEDYAERAYRAALYLLIAPFMSPFILYYFFRALIAWPRRRLRRPGRFAWHMLVITFLGLVPAALIFWSLLH